MIILFAANRSEVLKRFQMEDRADNNTHFGILALELSALPTATTKNSGNCSRSIGILACAPLLGERQRDANFFSL